MPTHRALRDQTVAALRAAGVDDPDQEARWLLAEATGAGAAELAAAADRPVPERAVVRVEVMAARRAGGEPLQYVLGRWGFRTLDLLVDARVLIPRPETEVVAGHALAALEGRQGAVAVDLGTGSGAIALSIAAETWPRVEVWATDVSAEALEVARANLSGLGRRGSVVRLARGDWFAALPEDLRGRLDVVVANPPYVAAGEDLPESVARWEPAGALVSGPTGLEAVERIASQAAGWLRADGVLVVEIGESQGAAACRLATAAGLVAEVHPDLAGRDRVLVGRRR